MKTLSIFIFLIVQIISNIETCPSWTIAGPNGNFCYIFLENYGAFSFAENDCVSRGGHIASVKDAITNSFLRNHAITSFGVSNPNFTYWLGGINIERGDNYVWTDGSKFSYENWASGQPPVNPNYCVEQQTSSGQWIAEDCETNFRYYACEISVNATFPSTTPSVGHCNAKECQYACENEGRRAAVSWAFRFCDPPKEAVLLRKQYVVISHFYVQLNQVKGNRKRSYSKMNPVLVIAIYSFFLSSILNLCCYAGPIRLMNMKWAERFQPRYYQRSVPNSNEGSDVTDSMEKEYKKISYSDQGLADLAEIGDLVGGADPESASLLRPWYSMVEMSANGNKAGIGSYLHVLPDEEYGDKPIYSLGGSVGGGIEPSGIKSGYMTKPFGRK
uniref:C-type lectin domain-containing protein n=1 Tax=Acrobeloides nanus TaxID=290746 RepID=A0A914CGE6_9BILA